MKVRSLLAVAVLALLFSASMSLAAEWWEEEQTSLVQSQQGKDADGNAYSVVTNWEDGYVAVTGKGTADRRTAVNDAQALAMAEDAARVRAYGQLAEAVLGFNITSEITVENGLADKSEQKMRLEGFLKGARVLEKQSEWLPDGSPVVTVKVGIVMNRKHPGISAPPPMPRRPVEQPTAPPPVTERPVAPPPVVEQPATPPPVVEQPVAPPPVVEKPQEKPHFLSQVLAVTIRESEETTRKEKQIQVYVPAADAPLPTGRGMEMGPNAAEEQVYEFPGGTEEKDYTGLIVDATGLGGSPSLAPKIFSEYGKEVWGTLEVDLDYAMTYGVADFAHNAGTAKGKERAGGTPLMMTAIRVEGAQPDSAFKSDFVVSEKAANFILKMNERMKAKDPDGKGFLEKCAVVFIL
jgi:hypothetical protein